MKPTHHKATLTILLIVISLIFLTSMTAYAHTAVVKNKGDGRYKSVLLSDSVLSHANYDLSDIRILDENENHIPYFINEFDKSLTSKNNLYPMEQVDSFIKEDNQIFDFTLTDIPIHDIEATSIDFFISNDDYIKNITIMGGI